MGSWFTIRESDSSEWDEHGMGRSDEKRGLITIDATMPEEQKRATVLHEIIHTIASMGAIPLDESSTCFIEHAFLSLIRDNHELIRWLADEV